MATITKRGDGWRCQVRLAGVPARSKTFDSERDAIDWGRIQEAEALEAKRKGSGGRRTLEEVIKRYLETVMPDKEPSTRSSQALLIKWWHKHHGHRYLVDLTPDLLAQVRDEHKLRASGPTANRYMSVLSDMLDCACREWHWIEVNPVSRVRRCAENRGLPRYLELEEIDTLLAACAARDARLHLVVLIGIYTGLRAGNILGLKWSQIDLARRLALIPRPKNKEPRNVPLAADVVKALRAFPRHVGRDWVFPGVIDPETKIDRHISRETFYKLYRDVCAQAGFGKDVVFHTLRHTFASHLAMDNVSPRALAEALGHKSIAMAMRYAHLSAPFVAGVVDSLAEKFRSAPRQPAVPQTSTSGGSDE